LRRGFVWAAVLISFAAGAYLVFAPEARATVVETVRIGLVNIFLGDRPSRGVDEGGTSGIEPPGISPAINFSGEMTLDELRQRAPFEVKLPAHPPGLGEPDRAFFQQQAGTLAILVWMDDEDPGNVSLSLHILEGDAFVTKTQPRIIQTLQVNGSRALWTEGPYYVEISGIGLQPERLIEGYVLIWEDEGLTYRLETSLQPEEAVQIAESLE
jgi:hypothetical protein